VGKKLPDLIPKAEMINVKFDPLLTHNFILPKPMEVKRYGIMLSAFPVHVWSSCGADGVPKHGNNEHNGQKNSRN